MGAVPRAEAREKLKARRRRLLAAAEDAIKNKDQAAACAAVERYGEQGHPERPVFDLLLDRVHSSETCWAVAGRGAGRRPTWNRAFAVSETGRCTAEKYYATTDARMRSWAAVMTRAPDFAPG